MSILKSTWVLALLFFVLILSCKESQDQLDYRVCNESLSSCINGSGNYCLFGYKWGEDNYFTPKGFNADGPKSGGGIVTFSFQESNGMINTHSQANIQSESFNVLLECAKPKIRQALDEWSATANIAFEELEENSSSDIRFYVATIRQGGIGYPNYSQSPCDQIAGNVVINPASDYNTCDSFHKYVLHEIGHTLGLGHVYTSNIMNPDTFTSLDGLQQGDVLGMIEIYGEK